MQVQNYCQNKQQISFQMNPKTAVKITKAVGAENIINPCMEGRRWIPNKTVEKMKNFLLDQLSKAQGGSRKDANNLIHEVIDKIKNKHVPNKQLEQHFEIISNKKKFPEPEFPVPEWKEAGSVIRKGYTSFDQRRDFYEKFPPVKK